MASKFTYDTASKLFILNAGVTTLDLKSEFYSWVKKDWQTDSNLIKYKFPILAIAGQDIGGGQSISPYYQLLYGWKIRPHEASHTLVLTGNLITDDGSDPLVNTLGNYNVRTKYVVSSSSLTVATGGTSASEVATAVWAHANAIAMAANTAKAIIIEKILKNKTTTNPSTGVMTVYDDDSTTVLFTANVFENISGTQTYRGQGADRRDKLTES